MQDPEPAYSLAVLARSWAEITGEAWERLLYRLGDWAITDAFPDDAFLTAGEDDSTFHKEVIFDRIRWHRGLVDKIHGAQDPNEKARLQKFADIHLQVAEVALLNREVIVDACRAMNVAPPPILGLVVGVSAKHRVPPECPLDFRVGVFAREVEQDQARRRRGEVMAPDEADEYTLLWDAAGDMSRANGKPLERSWLRLMDSFWRGDLAPRGLTYFYPAPPAGREFIILERTGLAGMLLGHRALETGTASIDDLCHWQVADYRNQPPSFREFFQHDAEGRFGLALPRQELEKWRKHNHGAPKRSRKTRPENDLRVRKQIEAVLAAQRGRWPDPTTRPPIRRQARILHEQLLNARPPLGLSEESLRQILSEKYAPMIRMGITGLSRSSG